jgi:hypothetical protein
MISDNADFLPVSEADVHLHNPSTIVLYFMPNGSGQAEAWAHLGLQQGCSQSTLQEHSRKV